jgi:hypothetical protein
MHTKAIACGQCGCLAELSTIPERSTVTLPVYECPICGEFGTQRHHVRVRIRRMHDLVSHGMPAMEAPDALAREDFITPRVAKQVSGEVD